MIPDSYYEVEFFQNEELLAYLNDNAVLSEKLPYDNVIVIYDSDIEESFAKCLESDENVKVYVTLPINMLLAITLHVIMKHAKSSKEINVCQFLNTY
jgi:restriction endonuclease